MSETTAAERGGSGGAAAFTVPFAERYLADYPVGAQDAFGAAAVQEEEVVAFARRFDPQPFHLDHDAAAEGPFGGLVASGWHTGALAMRILTDHYISPIASLGGPGVDTLRWTAPVRPGDVLHVRVEVLENRVSRSRPDRGILRTRVEVVTGAGTTVMSMEVMNMLRVGPAER